MASKEQMEFYDNFVDHFEEQKDNKRNKSFREWTQKWISPNSAILDVGCAMGYNSGYLQEYPIECQVTGIDLSPECIKLAHFYYPRCTWYCGDITEMGEGGFIDNVGAQSPFDVIIMSDVIEHIPLQNHRLLFKILCRWANPKTIILASVPDPMIHGHDGQVFQPVEEKVEIAPLLINMHKQGFSRVISVFKWDFYFRMVIQRRI